MLKSYAFSYAPWCPACKALGPTWQNVAGWSEDLDMKVGQIDVTENPGNLFFCSLESRLYIFTQGWQFASSDKQIFDIVLIGFYRFKWAISGHILANNLSVSLLKLHCSDKLLILIRKIPMTNIMHTHITLKTLI